MQKLPNPPKEAIVYEDEKLYVCLASFPLTPGHTVVVWKEAVKDIHSLSHGEYEHLMDIVGVARTTLLEALHLEKVYLVYMDEIEQVHWHLVPRYNEEGVNILAHVPTETNDFSLVPLLREQFKKCANSER